jgi:hypothetical protein
MKLAQPCGIADIGFAPRHVLGVTRIDQNDLKSVLLEDLIGRDPIDTGGFHRDADGRAFDLIGQRKARLVRRTGTIAARLLVELGTEPASAIAKAREVRPGAIENSRQERFVHESVRAQDPSTCSIGP